MLINVNQLLPITRYYENIALGFNSKRVYMYYHDRGLAIANYMEIANHKTITAK